MLIDISHFQTDAGPIDYTAVKAKAAATYVKLTQATTYVDPAWRQHHDGLAGIPRGGYHFCGRMDNLGHVDYLPPDAEAKHFADVLTKATWELRPVVDIEAPGADPAWLKAFLAALRSSTGIRRLRVYTSRALITGPLNPAGWIDADTDLWIARYNPTLGFDHPQLVLWQYTDAGHVPGIQGQVDLSVELHGWTPRADTQPDPVPTTMQESEPMIAIPLPVTPQGGFRATVMAEVGSASAVVAKAWITVGATWGDARFTITALDQQGHVIAHENTNVANNQRAVTALPDGCVMATIEGQTGYGAIPAAALVTQQKP